VKHTLVIGSTVVDVILNVPGIPRTKGDVNISSCEYRIGGCAHNVFMTLRKLNSPALLCSPVGGGVYGRMISDWFANEGLTPLVRLEQENGCCYCLVEKSGERSFLSHHGAEYLFSRDWMKKIDFSLVSDVFICGIEIEEQVGTEIVEFVFEHPELDVYFAPGPRIKKIPAKIMKRILSFRNNRGKGPFLHLNELEALRFSNKRSLEEAARYISVLSGNSVVITLGERGCYFHFETGEPGFFSPGFSVRAINTVGAGDAHCGAIIAGLKEGLSPEEACLRANRIGAAAVAGATSST